MNLINPSFGVYVTVIVVVAAVAAALLLSGRSARRYLARAGTSLGTGAVIAAGLTAYVDTRRHQALAAAVPGHVTVTGSLIGGFAGVTLAVAAVLYVLLTIAARSTTARADAAERAEYSPYRRRTGARR